MSSSAPARPRAPRRSASAVNPETSTDTSEQSRTRSVASPASARQVATSVGTYGRKTELLPAVLSTSVNAAAPSLDLTRHVRDRRTWPGAVYAGRYGSPPAQGRGQELRRAHGARRPRLRRRGGRTRGRDRPERRRQVDADEDPRRTRAARR